MDNPQGSAGVQYTLIHILNALCWRQTLLAERWMNQEAYLEDLFRVSHGFI